MTLSFFVRLINIVNTKWYFIIKFQSTKTRFYHRIHRSKINCKIFTRVLMAAQKNGPTF